MRTGGQELKKEHVRSPAKGQQKPKTQLNVGV